MDHIDFLPDRVRQYRAQHKRLIRQSYLVLLAAALLAVLGYFRQGAVRSAQAQLANMQVRCDDMQTQVAKRDVLQQQLSELEVMKRIDDQLGSTVSALDIMEEVERLLPKNVALTGLNIEAVEVKAPVVRAAPKPGAKVAAPKAADLTIKRVRLVLTGLTPSDMDVAIFMGQLSGSLVFEDATLGYARTVEFKADKMREGREFQISCYLSR